MDQNFIRMWLSGFESGLETLDDESRSELLRPCARRCADSGVINIYLNHLENVGYDRDAFYSRLGELTGCDGGIIIPGKKYFISYPSCLCDLHTHGGVNSPHLCECSRQSIIYVAKKMWGEVDFDVEIIETVLGGASKCTFHITFE
ncbi:MAG: hypothetical protein WC886_04880 [Saccharofermentanaceae bacterium]|jgi:hypothetical protein|nr:hypothetical protein [Clostridia bacterium]NLX68115.1 hypothetical protein [Clostridiaceae bacterium]